MKAPISLLIPFALTTALACAQPSPTGAPDDPASTQVPADTDAQATQASAPQRVAPIFAPLTVPEGAFYHHGTFATGPDQRLYLATGNGAMLFLGNLGDDGEWAFQKISDIAEFPADLHLDSQGTAHLVTIEPDLLNFPHSSSWYYQISPDGTQTRTLLGRCDQSRRQTRLFLGTDETPTALLICGRNISVLDSIAIAAQQPPPARLILEDTDFVDAALDPAGDIAILVNTRGEPPTRQIVEVVTLRGNSLERVTWADGSTGAALAFSPNGAPHVLLRHRLDSVPSLILLSEPQALATAEVIAEDRHSRNLFFTPTNEPVVVSFCTAGTCLPQVHFHHQGAWQPRNLSQSLPLTGFSSAHFSPIGTGAVELFVYTNTTTFLARIPLQD